MKPPLGPLLVRELLFIESKPNNLVLSVTMKMVQFHEPWKERVLCILLPRSLVET